MKQREDSERRIKRVILIRHARAEEHAPQLSDSDRSLTLKGKQEAKSMAKILKDKEKNPGTVLTSPAFRALETAIIFCKEYAIEPGNIRICPEIYSMQDNESYLAFLRSLDDEIDTVTMFGHNPMFSDVARYFTNSKTEDIPKTGIICISFNQEKWALLEPGSGKVDYFLKPDSLR